MTVKRHGGDSSRTTDFIFYCQHYFNEKPSNLYLIETCANGLDLQNIALGTPYEITKACLTSLTRVALKQTA